MSIEQRLADCLESLDTDPQSTDALDALANLVSSEGYSEEVMDAGRAFFGQRENWQGLHAFICTLLPAVTDNEAKAALLFELGRLLDEHLDDPDEAIRRFQESFKADTTNVAPLHAARSIYRTHAQFEAVAQLLRLELKVEQRSDLAASLWVELGLLLLDELKDYGEAEDALWQALELTDDLPEAEEALERLEALKSSIEHGTSGGVVAEADLEEVEPIAVEEVEEEEEELIEVEPIEAVVDEDDLIEIESAEATDTEEEVAETRSDDAEDVTPDDEVAEEDTPEMPETLEEEESDDVIEEVDTATEETPAVDEEDREQADDAAEAEPTEEDESVAEVGDDETVAEEPEGEADEDVVAAEEVDEDAEATAEHDALEQVDEDVEEPAEEEVAAAEEEAEPEQAEAEEAGEGEAEEAEASAEEPGDEEAELADEEAEDEEPPPVDDFPWEIPSKLTFEDWVERAEESEGEDRARAYLSAILVLPAPRDTGLVQDAFAAVLTADPDAVKWVANLRAAFLWDKQAWKGVLEALEERIESTDEPSSKRAAYEVAFYCLSDLERAIALSGPEQADPQEWVDLAKAGNWRKVHEELKARYADRGRKEAERFATRHESDIALGLGKVEKAITSLRKLSRSVELDAVTLDLLKGLYRAEGKWTLLIDMLKKQVKAPESHDQHLHHLRTMVHIYRTCLQNDVMEVQTHNAILKIEPNDIDSLLALSTMLEKMKRYPDLVDVLRRRAELAQTHDEKTELLLQVANLYVDKFSNQAEAVRSFEQVLTAAPENDQAVQFLGKVYKQRKDWKKFVAIRQQELGRMDDGDDKVEGLREIATVAFERLRNPGLSEELWRTLLNLAPEDEPALGQLAQVYDRQKDWTSLADVLERQLAVIEGEDQVPILERLGSLYHDRLSNKERAVDFYEALVEIDRGHQRASDALKKSYIDLKLWDRLEQFFADRENWTEYVRLVEHLAGGQKDSDEAVDLFFRAARVWLEVLEEPKRAVRALERVMSLDQANREAAKRLSTFYENDGNHRKLREVLLVLLSSEEDHEAQFELQVRLARLGAKLRDNTNAFEHFCAAVRTCPSKVEILDEVEKLAGAVKGWSELEQTYRLALDSLLYEPEEQAKQAVETVRLRLGRVLDVELDDLDLALVCFIDVLEDNPSNGPAIEASISIYARQGDHDSLLEIYRRKFELVEGVDEKVAILAKIAEIHETGKDEPANAIEDHEEILGLIEPEHDAYRETLAALHRLHARLEDWSKLVEVVNRELVSTSDDEQEVALSLQRELGEVSLHHLGEIENAVEAYAKVLAALPKDETARADVESLLEDDSHALGACEILEPIYEAEENWDPLVRVLEIRLSQIRTIKKTLGARKELLSRIVEIHATRRMDSSAAFEAATRLLKLDPTDDAVREQLEGFSHQTDGWAHLADVYVDLFGQLTTGRGKKKNKPFATLYANRVAQVSETYLDDVERAIEFYRTTLELAPDKRDALDAKAGLHLRAEQWPELLEAYKRQIELSDDAEEIRDIRFRIAALHEDQLVEPSEAISTYLAVLEDHAEDHEALAALDRLYDSQGQFAELAENLEKQIALSERSSDEWCHFMCRLGNTREEQLGEIDEAVGTYKEVLDARMDNVAALTALERLIEEDMVAGRVARILAPIYDAFGEQQKLVDTLHVELDHTEELDERLTLYHRIAELQERGLADSPSAFRTLLSAAAESPLHDPTIDTLYRMAGEQQAWGELVARFDDLAIEQDEPSDAAALYVRLAQLSEERLVDPRRAAGYWRSVLEQTPMDSAAIHALERLYRDLTEWDELVEILLQKVELEELSEDVDQQKMVLFQAATIYDEFLQRLDDAITTVERVLALDGGDQNALDELNRLYRATDRWADLIEILTRRIDLSESDEERRDIWYEMGPVHEERLENAVEAIEVYRAIVDKFPEERPALGSLIRLYTDTEDWAAKLDILAHKQGLAETPEEGLDLRYEQGNLLQNELYEIGKSIDVYAEVLASDPSHPAALGALEGMIRDGQEMRRVSEVLDPLYRTAGEWSKLIDTLKMLVEDNTDPIERADYFVQIADIHEHELVDLNGAFDAVCVALSEVPSRAELADRAERLAGQQERWSELVTLFEQLRDDVSEAEPRLALGKRAARIYESELNTIDAAIGAFIAVADIDPNDGDALVALDRLYEQSFQWNELADVLERRILLVEGTDSIELQYRLGTVLRSQLADPVRAVETFNEILSIESGNPKTIAVLEEMFADGAEAMEIARILEPHYREREDWTQLVELKLATLQHQDDPEDQFSTLCEAGEISTEQIGDAGQSLVIFGQALAVRPSDESILETLERLAMETENYPALTQILNTALSTEPNDLDAQRLSLKLAEVLNDKVGDVESATEWFKFTLELDPANVRALAALDAIYKTQERWPELGAILEQERDQAMSDADIVSFCFRLAQLNEHQLDDLASAIGCYRDVIDVQPDHREALGALESIFQRQMDWEELYIVYEQRSGFAETDAERAEVFQQMASLAMNMLERPDDSIELWLRVLDNRPNDLNALVSLEVLYETTERQADLVDVLEQRVNLSEDEDEKRDLIEKIGRTQRMLGDDEKAVEAYRRLLEMAPGHREALLALRELYEERGESEALADVLHQIVGGGELDEAGLLDAHYRLGELHGDVLGNPEKAITSWNQVLQLEPGDEAALDQLERHYLDQEQWTDAVEVLEQKTEIAESPADKIDLLYRVSEIWQSQVSDLDGAANAYERLLQLEPSSDQAFLSLEEIYRSQSNWDRLIEIYLGQLQHLPNQLDRLEILAKAADTYEKEKEDPASAFLVVARMFKEDPLDPDTASRLETLAEAAGMWDTLVELYSDTIGEVVTQRGVDETLELHQRVSTYYRERTGRPEMAEVHYHKVLDIDPADEAALKGLEDIYQDSHAWNELVAILKRRLDLPIDVDEQINLLLKIGLIEQTQIGNSDEAIHSFNMVLSLDGENLDAIAALEEIYESREEWRELIEVLDQHAAITYDPEAATEIRFRIGSLWESNLQIPERAIDVYRDILASVADHVPSLDRLEALYVQLEKWDRYLDVLEMRLGLDPPPDQRVETLLEMARVYEREFDELERAIDAYREVLVLEPGRMDVITLLHDAYVRGEYWEDLARLLSEQVDHITDSESQIDLLTLEARTAADYLDDMFRAIGCFQRILDIDENHVGALNGLADLYEKVGQWEDCIATYDKLILVSTEVRVQTVLLCRVGRIYEAHILDDDSAGERYQTALDLDPGCEEAMRSLRQLYVKRQEWDAAVVMLQREVDYSKDLTEKSALLGQIGAIYEDRDPPDQDTAVSFFQQAMDLDPYNVMAAAPLAEYYLDQQEWARALPLLQALIERNPYGDQPEALQHLHHSLGVALEELDQEDQALEHLLASYELNADHLETLEGLSRIYARRQDTERAYELLGSLIENHADVLGPDVLAQYLVQQADIKWADGDKRAAQELFERALANDADHAHALRRMIEVLLNKEDWQRIVDYQVRLAEVSDDPVEQFTLLLDAGDTFRQSLGQTEAAIEAYRAALRVDEDSMAVLHRLLEIFTQVEDWQRAAEILVKMAQLETDPEKHARRCRTIGFLLMDNLGETERAVEFFNRALDTYLALDFLDAFEAVENIMAEQKDWARLAKQYKKMIKRVSNYEGEEDMLKLKVMLWRNLGEIYRTRLQAFDNAIEAYKAAAQLDPNNSPTHAILAQLYELVGGHERAAIDEYHELIQTNPFHFDTYHLLFARYLEQQDFDAAWCVSGALVLFNQANEQEKAYYERYLGPSPPVANKTLTNEQWELMNHPKLSRGLSRIMQAFTTSLRHVISYDLAKTWKVHKKKDLLDLHQDLAFAKRYNYTINVLGVPPANVYVMRDQIGGIRNANADPPALVVGHDMLQGRTERELAFEIGKALCLMKPEYYVGSAYPSTNNLKIFFLAAMRVARPEAAIPVDSTDLDRLVGEIERNPHLKVALKNVTDHYIQQNENPNFSIWLKALEYTSDRTGLLLAGDVGQAVASIKNAQLFSLSKATTKERLQEVVLFSMSRPYMSLRQELGLAIAS